MESGRRMDPALYKAATQGRVSSLKQLTEEDTTMLGATTPQLNTVLHLAALHGHADFAREVLEIAEGNMEDLLVARNDDGDTALHLAAKAGNLEVAKLLISRAKEIPDAEDKKSPLVMTNKEGNSPLHEAVRHHRSGVAVALLDADPLRGHDLNERMESPLHMAAREGLVNVVSIIVDHAWVDQEFLPWVSLSGTALHQAVLGGHIRIVEILLAKRPDLIDLTDSDGNNALHYAAQKNYPRAVEMLLGKQSELAYKPNLRLESPLHVAAQYGSTDAIKALLRRCPDVAEMANNLGRNAFHTSVHSGKLNALKCLLRHVRPAELLNRVDGEGKTPLHLAVGMSRVPSALMLLKDPRVDLCVRDRDGHTARSLLEQKLHTMDAYEMYLWKQLKQQESRRCRKQQLPPLAPYPSRRASSDKYFDHVVETYILVATLIATVTFAATFTMPGGYYQNQDEGTANNTMPGGYSQLQGTAIHGHRPAFKIFVISNTIAMCSSIVVVFCFIWAWQDPVKFKVDQLLWGHRLTVIACLGMLVSMMTAVYITVEPTSRWPAYVAIAIGASTPAVVVLILGREVIYVPL